MAPPSPAEYKHLDITASRVAATLREKGIDYIFCGGYAAGLIGSERVTKDVNVITNRDPSEAFKSMPEFICLSSHSWKYRYCGTMVNVEFHESTRTGRPWQLPKTSSTAWTMLFALRTTQSVPSRFKFRCAIMRPETLAISKLRAWRSAEESKNPTERARAHAHLMAIMAALQWLSSKAEPFKVNGGTLEGSLTLLKKFYRDHKQARPLLAQVFSSDQLARVLNPPPVVQSSSRPNMPSTSWPRGPSNSRPSMLPTSQPSMPSNSWPNMPSSAESDVDSSSSSDVPSSSRSNGKSNWQSNGRSNGQLYSTSDMELI